MKTFITQLFAGTYNSKIGVVAVGLFGCYLFLIANTIITVNDRKSIVAEIRDLSITTTEQETKYLGLIDTITMDTALARGFIDTSYSRFVYTSPQDETVAVR